MRSYSAVDVGLKRKINQDCVFASEEPVGNLPNLFIVADGMGGHNAGDFASRSAVKYMTDHIRSSEEKEPVAILRSAIENANSMLLKESTEHEELKGMGTTLVVSSVTDGHLHVANIGDSRLYVLGAEGIAQITVDHSLVEEMVRIGEISRADARTHPDKNIITRALGTTAEVDIDFFDETIEEGDVILMCSDGLTNMVEDSVIEAVLKEDLTIEEKTQKLINTANKNGGKDNIAVIIIEPGTIKENN